MATEKELKDYCKEIATAKPIASAADLKSAAAGATNGKK
jgi:hypothetical protein